MRWAEIAAVLALAACAAPPPPPAATLPPAQIGQASIAVSSLPGWADEDHLTAFRVFRTSCLVSATLADVCGAAQTLRAPTQASAREFFERRFVAQQVANTPPGPGLLTAYFSPVYEARTTPDSVYSAPLRPRPADLQVVDGALLDPTLAGRRVAARIVNGRVEPYPTRGDIEARREPGLAYLKAEDLFFLQLQGSGLLVFPDGSRRRAVYAADNGRPFVGIARVMRDRGVLADHQTSGEAIRAWLAAHRGPEAQAMMNENPRYAFMALQPFTGGEPAGAVGVPLTPGRAIAIDPTQHRYGQPYWIDGVAPALSGAFPAYRRLVIALDTGGAIRGPVRADLYLGSGAAAGTEAGRVRHQLTMYRLAPSPR